LWEVRHLHITTIIHTHTHIHTHTRSRVTCLPSSRPHTVEDLLILVVSRCTHPFRHLAVDTDAAALSLRLLHHPTLVMGRRLSTLSRLLTTIRTPRPKVNKTPHIFTVSTLKNASK
jgi:hypothetical protein